MQAKISRIISFKTFYAGYFAIYLFYYLGWIFAGNTEVGLFDFSSDYSKFVIIAALPFFLPLLIRFLIKKFRVPGKTLLFAVTPVIILSLLAYSIASIHYSWTAEHRFDPYLQLHPIKFDPTVPKAENEYRILFLGGSTTEQKGYPARVQADLQQKFPDKKIVIFNAGRAWYTSRHSLINYVTYYYEWKPDLVVVMHGINDLMRSFTPHQYARGSYDDLWSHFYGASTGGALPDPFENQVRKVIKNSGIFGFNFGTAIDAWYSYFLYRPTDYPLERFASLSRAEKNLRELARAAKNHGAQILFVTQPSLYKDGLTRREKRVLKFCREQASERKWGWYHEYPSSQSMKRAMAAYQEMVLRVAQEENVWSADAASRFPRDRTHFMDDVHYSGDGERVIGQLVAARLAELIQ